MNETKIPATLLEAIVTGDVDVATTHQGRLPRIKTADGATYYHQDPAEAKFHDEQMKKLAEQNRSSTT